MYLRPESVANLFKIIYDYAGAGSEIVFDFIYSSVLRRENLYEGENEYPPFTLLYLYHFLWPCKLPGQQIPDRCQHKFLNL